MTAVADNLARVLEQLTHVGRSVSIVGVTKLQPVERIQEAVDAGIRILAVNYVQEGQTLFSSLRDFPGEWHFIGHIQSRKVKFLPAYQCVQSLDRMSVAHDLNEVLERIDKTLEVCVEVNIGSEPQKSGVLPDDLGPCLKELASLNRLRLKGIMSMPPFLEPVELRRPFFRRLKELFDRYQSSYGLETLSMGTSEDYLIAVEEGSNMIRLGTLLFGSRE